MGSRKLRSLLASLIIIFSIFAASSAAQPSDSFHSLLRSRGLPIGIVPRNITSFSLDDTTGRFEVYLDRSCSAKFENEVHYEINVTGTLTYGQVGDLSGMSAQELFLWFPVKGIRVDVPSSGLIYFDVGGVVSKQFSLSLFDAPPDCVDVGPVELDDQMLNFSRFERQSEEPQPKFIQREAMRAAS
uniref:DUF538 family protein n=1 Tax=Kalanchoe fedtschenkoi TaxID=63787 RepID=A0A7N0U241_KALFE